MRLLTHPPASFQAFGGVVGYAVTMYGSDYQEKFPYCLNWGAAWANSYQLGTQYLPELLQPILGKNPSSNQPVNGINAHSLYICPAGLHGSDPAVPTLPQMIQANADITYVWNHIFLTADRSAYDLANPVSGRKTARVASASTAVLLWEMPYWTPSTSPHHGGLNLIFADCHAAWEKRNPTEIDWWSYHSRRGWDDNNTGL